MVITKIKPGYRALVIMTKDNVLKYFNENPTVTEITGHLVSKKPSGAITIGVEFPVQFNMGWQDESMVSGNMPNEPIDSRQ